MTPSMRTQRGFLGLPIIALAVLLALLAAWGMRSKEEEGKHIATARDKPSIIGPLVERSEASLANQRATIQLRGAKRPVRVDMLPDHGQFQGQVAPTATVTLQPGQVLNLSLPVGTYRLHATTDSGGAISDSSMDEYSYIRATSDLVIDLGRLRFTRLPFPTAGS